MTTVDPIVAAITALSQLPRYSIGRTAGNAIAIPNARVSSQHAALIRCSDQLYVLEDLGSKHGTFVNELRVTRKLVGPDDTLRFADSSFSLAELLRQLAGDGPTTPTVSSVHQAGPVSAGRTYAAPIQAGGAQAERSLAGPAASVAALGEDALDYRAEFAALKAVFVQYPMLRKACRDREKMIRTGSVIVSSVVGVGAVLATGGAGLPLLQVLSSAGLSILVPTLCSTLLSTDEKLEVIDKEYRERYRCPNPTCRDPFGFREWEQLAQQKSCRRCRAIWAD